MIAVPAGLVTPVVPVTGDTYSSLGRNYSVKYSYACISPLHAVLAAAFETTLGAPLPPSAWPGICADGMNTQGLAVSLQWNRAINLVNNYKGKGPALDQVDLAHYILGNFKTAAEVKARVDAGLQVRAWWCGGAVVRGPSGGEQRPHLLLGMRG